MSAVLPSATTARPAEVHPALAHRCAAAGSGVAARTHSARPLGGAAVAAAVLAQGIVLARLGGSSAATLVVSAVVALACAAAWAGRHRMRHADVLVTSLAFGGLGMMAGEWIARAAAPPMHHAGMHAAPSAASWVMATGVMLLTCAAACRWTCAPLCRGGWLRRVTAHCIAAAGMVGGMAAAGALLSPALAAMLGATAGMHAAMAVGMTAGVAAALPLVARVSARAA